MVNIASIDQKLSAEKYLRIYEFSVTVRTSLETELPSKRTELPSDYLQRRNSAQKISNRVPLGPS